MEQWVKDMKADAMRKRLLKKPGPSFSLPISYTGAGADGVVQPSRSAGMGMAGSQPFMVHEGEMETRIPEGSFMLNTSTTQKAYPSFESGGFARKRVPAVGTAEEITNNVDPSLLMVPVTKTPVTANIPTIAGATPTVTSPTSRVNPITVDVNQFHTPVLNENIKQPPSSEVPSQGIQQPVEINPENVPLTTGMSPTVAAPTATTTTAEDAARTAGLDYMTGTLNKTNDALMLEGRRAVDELSARQQQERSAREQEFIQQGVDPSQARVEMQMLRNTQETELNDLGAKYGIAGMQARETAATNLASTGLAGQQFEQGKSEFQQTFDLDKQKYGDSKAWTDFEYTAQYGSDADVIAAYKAATGKDLDPSAVAEIRGYARSKREQDITSGRLNITAQEIQNEASGLAVDADRLTAFINAVNNGANLASANMTSGLDLTQQQMDGITTKYRQAVEAGNLELQSTRNKVGDEIYDSIQDMINSGSYLTSVNQRLREQGRPELSYDEFQGMLDATPLGERNWGRKMTAANMLLSTPGGANKDQAAAIYGDLFPGVSFDFDKITSAEKGEEFASGLSLVAEYVASGLKFEEVYGILQAGGALEKMGLTDPMQLRNLYNSMNVNAVDAEWKEMETSDFYASLSKEEQSDQMEFFKQKMLGQLDYTTLHEYEIYNPDGTLNTTVYGKDSAEADKKAASLGSGYTVKDTNKVKFQMASTLTGGTASTTGVEVKPSKEGQGSDKEVGTIYKDDSDKRIYEVGAGGEIKEIVVDPVADAWTQKGDDLISLGSEDNPYYSSIMKERAYSIVNGTHPVENKITEIDLYDASLKVATKWEPQTPVGADTANQKHIIMNAPKIGSIINYKNGLYKVITDPVDMGLNQYLDILDLKTGKKMSVLTLPGGGVKIVE